GNGDGTLKPPRYFPAAAGSGAVIQHDFNGDGRPDLAVVDQQANKLSILINDTLRVTALSFTPGSTLAAGPANVVVTFNQNIDPLSANQDTLRLVRAGL